MYKSRSLNEYKEKYNFVIFALGKIKDINENINKKIIHLNKIFPDAIQINKLLIKDKEKDSYEVLCVDYPVHLRRIYLDFQNNESLFYEAVKGKIKIA